MVEGVCFVVGDGFIVEECCVEDCFLWSVGCCVCPSFDCCHESVEWVTDFVLFHSVEFEVHCSVVDCVGGGCESVCPGG